MAPASGGLMEPWGPRSGIRRRASAALTGVTLAIAAVSGWRVWRRIRWDRTFLRAALPVGQGGDAQVRWIVRAGVPALVLLPGARLVWRLYAPPGARFRARGSSSFRDAPGARAQGSLAGGVIGGGAGPDAVTLSVDIDSAYGRQSARVSLTPSPGPVRWQRIDLPAGLADIHEVTLTLAAHAEGGTAASCEALVAEPILEWPRPLSEIRNWLRALGGGLRLQQAVHRIRHLGRPHEVIDAYREWQRRHECDFPSRAAVVEMEATFRSRPRISVITPVHDTDPIWLRACIESVRRQVYSNWELCLVDDGSDRPATREVLARYGGDSRIRVQRLPSNAGIAAASNAAWRLASGDYIVLLDHDDELAPSALFEVARLLNERPGLDVIYGDEDKLDLAGVRGEPALKPDWSPEYLLSCMYVGHPIVLRRGLVEDLGGFRPGYEGAQDYDLILRVTERTRMIAHVPKVLYHWRKLPGSAATPGMAKPWAVEAARRALADAVRRRGLEATVEPGLTTTSFRVRHRVRRRPVVSAIVAQGALGGHALGGYRPLELISVHDGAVAPAALQRDGALSYQRLVCPSDASASRRFNLGSALASGDYLVCLGAEATPLDVDWLVAMLEHAQHADIGLVGCRGVRRKESPGTADAARRRLMVHNPETVDPACFMIRRDLFQRLGGLADAGTIEGAVADLCARIRAGGQRIVYTPYGQKRGREWTPSK